MNKLLVTTLLLTCSTSFAVHYSEVEGKFDCPEISNSMQCARSIERKLSKEYEFIQRENDKTLKIVLLFNGIQTYKDSEAHYSVLEYIEEHQYLVIHQQYWEGHAYALLNMKNGNFFEITGYPYFSPDGQLVAVVEQDIEAGYSPNTLQIYEVGNQLELIFDAKPDLWGPGKVKWVSNKALAFTKTKFNENYDPFNKSDKFSSRYIEEPALLEFQSGVWVITLNKSSKRDAVTGAPS